VRPAMEPMTQAQTTQNANREFTQISASMFSICAVALADCRQPAGGFSAQEIPLDHFQPSLPGYDS